MDMIIRVAMIASVNTLLENVIWIRFFQRHRSLAFIVCVGLGHAIIQNCLTATYLPAVTNHALWAQQLNAFCAIVFIFLAVAAYLYTYYFDDVSLIKTLVMQPIVDLIMSCLLVVTLIILNFMEGRYPLTTITGNFHPLDLLFPVLLLIVLMIFLKFTDGLINYYRQYEIKHPNLVAFFLFLFYAFGFFSTMSPHSVGGFTVMAALSLVIGLMFYGAIVLDARNKAKYALLQMSQDILENHYHEIQESISDIDVQRQEVEEKMALLMAHDFPDDLTKQYLERMVLKKNDLHHALFTSYFLIDALLSMQVKKSEGRITYHFRLNFTLEGITQVELCEVLQILFRYGETLSTNEINLDISNVAHQLLIGISYHQKVRLHAISRQLHRIAGLDIMASIDQGTLMLGIKAKNTKD